jgi:hypothetical protein
MTDKKVKAEDARADALVAAYAHGLEHNAPRTAAEFAELKFMLSAGPDPQLPKDPDDEEVAKRKAFDESVKRDEAQRKVDAKAAAKAEA